MSHPGRPLETDAPEPMVKICVPIVGCHGGGAFKQPPGHSPGSPNSRPTALPQSLLEVAAGVPSHPELKLAGVVIANWSHERVFCWTFVGQQCCHNMSLDDTHDLNPGGKTCFRAVFSHSWIGFLNRASQVRILPGPHQKDVLGLMTLVVSIAMRLISIACTRKTIKDSETRSEYRKALLL